MTEEAHCDLLSFTTYITTIDRVSKSSSYCRTKGNENWKGTFLCRV